MSLRDTCCGRSRSPTSSAYRTSSISRIGTVGAVLEECSAREHRVRAVLSAGLSEGTTRGDPDQPGRQQHCRCPRCERRSGRPRLVAVHRANVLLIPGTRTRDHLTENLAAGGLWLHDREIALLNQEFS